MNCLILYKYLKTILETAELKIDLEPLAHSEFLVKMFSSKGEILIGAKGLDYFDGFSILSYFRDQVPGNYFHVHDSNIDKKMDKVLTEFDSRERAKNYKDIQIDILKHLTVVPLLFGSEDPGLWSKKVKAVPAHPGGLHMLPFESIEMNL